LAGQFVAVPHLLNRDHLLGRPVDRLVDLAMAALTDAAAELVLLDIEIPLRDVDRFCRKAKVSDPQTNETVDFDGHKRRRMGEIERDDLGVAQLAFNDHFRSQ
jgi:hypothetical protein